MSQTQTLNVGGSDMKVLIETPEGNGPFPALIVVHHGPGLDAFTQDVLERLAARGAVAVAPDFYHRRPPEHSIKEKVEAFQDGQIVDDIIATKAMLSDMEDVQSDKIGIMGHCLGGRLALLGAGSVPDFRVLVIFYGGNTLIPWGREAPAPIDLVENIECPVIGFYGNEDTNPSPDDVNRLSAELTKHGKRHTFHRYDDIGHAFQNFVAEDRYREASSNDAWGKLNDFIDAELK